MSSINKTKHVSDVRNKHSVSRLSEEQL